MTGYEPSYYVASRNPGPRRHGLAGRVSTDVCVVGGGYAGLSAALELAERGFHVTLLEAALVGFGASGRNGGQMLNGLNPGVAAVEKLAGETASRAIWDMTVEATDIVRRRIQRHAIACDWRPGYVHAATKPSHFKAMVEDAEMMAARYGYHDQTVLDRAALAAHVVSERYHGGVFDHGGGHLHPLNYALGLAEAAETAGVVIHEDSRVTEIQEGPRPLVRTAHGEVDCAHVVLAANAYVGDLRPRLARTIMPVATFIIATEPLGAEVVNRLMPSNPCVSDSNFVLDYFRRSADHRILFGGGASYSGRTGPHEPMVMRGKMAKTFPELRDVKVEHFWGGLVDITANRLPDFGRLGDNLWYLQGFSGHGIALTNLAGKLVAEAVAGDAGRFDVFARLKHRPFPGGPLLRTPLLMAAMMWFRLRDLLS
ncbi:FAD-binding oxidoreductase [Zavarzinia compransoris]|uniref:NAD(P)/FAD-dependent oxidoreductase n=1 Tax=Zavarzinia marina TaxID=2911065 RepID=UPI001F1E372E|nr:FAD-binding oxidoreductase [Zavarzinia marina]MCF4164287.1 FAD-binding oxidoreductase [Zavarzinia marina]